MSKYIIIGGSNGIGREFSKKLSIENQVIVFDISEYETTNNNIKYVKFNLLSDDLSIFDDYKDIDGLIITAGIGRLAPFETFNAFEIERTIGLNLTKTICLIRYFYDLIISNNDFYCLVMGSISAYISSPLFSVYSSSKSGLVRFIESVNSELASTGRINRILNVSPGRLEGTKFYGANSNLESNEILVKTALDYMHTKKTEFIPDYDNIYKKVINKYRENPIEFGIESYDYKIKSGKINIVPKIIVGYLSGTFDLFHIGHLNVLKNAKKYCDYLIVGVHKDGSHKGKNTYIPFEERVEILKSIKYVDKVIQSKYEDSDIYFEYKYDMLFVGSDYKNTDRFNRYEEFFKGKDVKIVYLPYTQTTSSTEIRKYIDNVNSKSKQ
jgi:glycerol-3-phosphate cytidylyltransferase